MRLCKRCSGSGNLFRPEQGKSIAQSFKKCTDCGGHGVRGIPKFYQPKEIVIDIKWKAIRKFADKMTKYKMESW